MFFWITSKTGTQGTRFFMNKISVVDINQLLTEKSRRFYLIGASKI